jgi:biopolymer transport protein ExbD
VKLERNFKINPALVGVVPLINVMFLVLLFFTLGSRFVLQSGMAISLPTSTFTLTPSREPQLVTITASPIPSIYHGDQRIALEELGPRLKEVPGKDRSLVIKADSTTSYDLLMSVVNVGLQQGFSIVLATSPQAR